MPHSNENNSKDEALLALHAAVEMDPLWKALNLLLRESIPCYRVTLFLGHIGMHEARKVYTDPPMPNLDRDYYSRRAEANPYSPIIEENIGISHYRFSDIIPNDAAFQASTFYREFAEPEGWATGLSGLVWLGKDLRGMFSLYRRPGEPDFSDADIETLEALLPNISIAIDRVKRLHRERLYRMVLEDFNRNLPVGLLLLDWELQLIYANTEAIRLIANWNFGVDANKQYNPREVFELPKDILAACAALRDEIIESGDEALRHMDKAPTQLRCEASEIECAIQPIRLNKTNIAYPGFFITFESQLHAQRSDPESVSQDRLMLLNQLSPSERELALLVGEGLSNKEIAERLGKSVLTVKKQLNSAFGKLNIANRARLIALLR
jgi:DNA-binding CsgD family transcriptional regulator